MALMPPVSAISGTIGPSCAASARLIARPTSVEPVKTTPAIRGSATRLAPTAPSPGTKMQRPRRHAGLVQERDRKRGDERRLLGRLGDDRIAGDERGADLAEENRERKIPRADADEHAAAAIAQLIAFAGRPRHRLWRKSTARLRGIIAAIIDRLAQFGERVIERLAGLVLQQSEEPAAIRLEPVGGAFEHRGALLDRRRRPGRKAGLGGGNA